jgi:hypothetical protein
MTGGDTMGAANRVAVERLGGFGGFGGPGAHLRSRGEVELSRLSAADRDAINALFGQPVAPGAPMPDGFRYRLTRHIAGVVVAIEVSEQNVPAALRDCVADTLD